MDIGKIGIWFFLDGMNAAESVAFAQKVEKLGYGAMWIPEAVGREPFAHSAYLAAHTEKVVFATGIANIWARDPITMSAASKTVAEVSNGRFLLGIGVSHKPLVSNLRGHSYDKPYSYMKDYLPKMKSALYRAPLPKEEVPVVIAALHPKMLALAAEQTQGTHTYFVPPEHTAKTRAAIGPKPWICAAQAVILETDATKARAMARTYMKTYVPRLPNYTNNLKNLGWQDKDFENGCSDALVDAIVAWGTADKIRDRIDDHLKAGATHVCILPIRVDNESLPDPRVMEALAPKQ
ncbi:MAG TPA: TIGR03620 family F420-dependent LLM class oxidoreductase [Candidatus Binataceae bacterium]|nr:TIGR03620 family F420-dependent LLM class oxidoreductase [Candidatus Binataceae bacterium]